MTSGLVSRVGHEMSRVESRGFDSRFCVRVGEEASWWGWLGRGTWGVPPPEPPEQAGFSWQLPTGVLG